MTTPSGIPGAHRVPDEAPPQVLRLSKQTPAVSKETPASPADTLHVLAALNEGWDGAVPTMSVADTIKRVDGERVVETLPREQLRAVQTPQAFVVDVLRRALTGSDWTDCAAAVEAGGGRVKAVDGDPRLVKITDSVDLDRVAALL